MTEAVTTRSALEVLAELRRRGYTLDVQTRTEAHDHKVGAQTITYADQLLIRGDAPLDADLRAAVTENRDELLAAACVISPPVEWLEVLARRCRSRFVFVSERTDAAGERIRYRITPDVLAANVASFCGLHPAHDGPRLEPIIREALR